MYGKDYRKLYRLQDKFLAFWKTLEMPFYLTGGTALGRFYLNHRFSEDLDFFINSSFEYSSAIRDISKSIDSHFELDLPHSLFTEDFTRLFIIADDTTLKIEFVNDAAYIAKAPISFLYGKIDTPLNILSNKLTAIAGRDEPKDVFDIINISTNYSFEWPEIFNHAKQKMLINEIDIERRLHAFPISLFQNVDWFIEPVDINESSEILLKITDDFLLGKPNSLGDGKLHIELAAPADF